MYNIPATDFMPENFSNYPITKQMELLLKGLENVAEHSRNELEEANSKIYRLEREVQNLVNKIYGQSEEDEEPFSASGAFGSDDKEDTEVPDIFDDDDVEEERKPDYSILARCSSGVGLTLSYRYIGSYKLAKERNPKYKYAVVWKAGRDNAHPFDTEKEAQEVLQNCKLPTGYSDPKTIADM